MKKKTFIMTTLLLLLITQSCTDQIYDPKMNPEITITPLEITATDAASDYLLNIESNFEWTAVVDEEATAWCHVQLVESAGNRLLPIAVDALTVAGERSATITIKGKDIMMELPLKQVALPQIDLTTENEMIPANGSSITIFVNSNVTWTATTDATWCTLEGENGAGNGTFTVNAQSLVGTGLSQRAVAITVNGGGTSKTIELIQSQYMHVTPESATVGVGASTVTINVNSDIAWSAELEASASTWCKLDNTAASNDMITLNITANPSYSDNRKATITIKAGTLNKQIIITQKSRNVDDEGVILPGLTNIEWATRNVGDPGYFTTAPDDRGLVYRFNDKKGYNLVTQSADPTYIYKDSDWEEENNPCPSGWRVCTYTELSTAWNNGRTWRTPAQTGFSSDGIVIGIPNVEASLATKENLRGGLFIPNSGWLFPNNGIYDRDWLVAIQCGTQNGFGTRAIFKKDSGSYESNGEEKDDKATAVVVRCVRDITHK